MAQEQGIINLTFKQKKKKKKSESCEIVSDLVGQHLAQTPEEKMGDIKSCDA